MIDNFAERAEVVRTACERAAAGGVAVLGPPGCGLTTILRDISDTLGSESRFVRATGHGIGDIADATDAVVIDDADRLDRAAIAALHAYSRRHPLVIGVHTGRATDELAWLWRSGSMHRVHIADLSSDSIAHLVERVLGQRPHRSLVSMIAAHCGGRPGFAVDELDSLRLDGKLIAESGVVRAASSIGVGALLAERATELMRSVGEARAADVVTVAFAGWLPDTMAAALDVDVAELERLGIVSIGGVGTPSPTGCALVPPILAASVRRTVAARTAREISMRIVDAGADELQLIDRVRLASSLGSPVQDDELAEAARVAIRSHEPAMALDFAEQAAHRSIAGRLLEAEILQSVGRRLDALARYEAIVSEPIDDVGSYALASVECSLQLLWDCGRPTDAMQIAEQLTTVLADSVFIDAVRAHHAALSLYSARLGEARAILGRIDESGVDPTTRRFIELVRVTNDALVDPAADVVVGGLLASGGPFEPAVGLVAACLALEMQGRLIDAQDVIDEHRRAIAANCTAAGAGWMALAECRIHLAAGRTDAARRSAADAEFSFVDADHPTGYRWAVAGALLAAALAGDVARCHQLSRQLDGAQVGAPFLDSDVARARAWAAMATGHSARAAELFDTAAAIARRSGARGLEAVALHDAYRCGRPVDATRLAELARRSPAPGLVVRVRHLERAAADDPVGLLRVAREFEELGAFLHAAETAADATACAARLGLRSTQRIAARERTRLAGRCGPFATPKLAMRSVTTLTPRERDVALAASSGSSSRRIASEFGISIRTVDNMLGRIYVKLGVDGRNELANHVGPPATGNASLTP